MTNQLQQSFSRKSDIWLGVGRRYGDTNAQKTFPQSLMLYSRPTAEWFPKGNHRTSDPATLRRKGVRESRAHRKSSPCCFLLEKSCCTAGLESLWEILEKKSKQNCAEPRIFQSYLIMTSLWETLAQSAFEIFWLSPWCVRQPRDELFVFTDEDMKPQGRWNLQQVIEPRIRDLQGMLNLKKK